METTILLKTGLDGWQDLPAMDRLDLKLLHPHSMACWQRRAYQKMTRTPCTPFCLHEMYVGANTMWNSLASPKSRLFCCILGRREDCFLHVLWGMTVTDTYKCVHMGLDFASWLTSKLLAADPTSGFLQAATTSLGPQPMMNPLQGPRSTAAMTSLSQLGARPVPADALMTTARLS